MSNRYDACIIFGFPVPPGRNIIQAQNQANEFGRDMYLDEWLDESGLRPLTQINAGVSNGGRPEFLCGVVFTELDDFTRCRAYVPVSALERPTGPLMDKLIKAKRALVPANLLEDEDYKLDFYLVGELA